MSALYESLVRYHKLAEGLDTCEPHDQCWGCGELARIGRTLPRDPVPAMTSKEIVDGIANAILDLNRKEYGDYAILEAHAEERARNIAQWFIGEIRS